MSFVRILILSLFLSTIALLAADSVAAQSVVQGATPDFNAKLQKLGEIYVATERKSGERSKAVPVWFGVMDGALWFTTAPNSYKGKRVRRGSPMYVSVDGIEGPFLKMKAEIVKDGAKAEELGRLYAQKYWIAWLGFFKPGRARNESGKTILLKMTPAN